MRSRTAGMFLTLALLCLQGRTARAEDSAAMSPLAYAVAGVFLVDVFSCVSNGIALASPESNRTHARVGIIAGSISLGLVAVSLVVEDDAQSRNEFAFGMGGVGAATLTLAVLNLRKSREESDQAEGVTSQLRLYSSYTGKDDASAVLGIAASFGF